MLNQLLLLTFEVENIGAETQIHSMSLFWLIPFLLREDVFDMVGGDLVTVISEMSGRKGSPSSLLQLSTRSDKSSAL